MDSARWMPVQEPVRAQWIGYKRGRREFISGFAKVVGGNGKAGKRCTRGARSAAKVRYMESGQKKVSKLC